MKKTEQVYRACALFFDQFIQSVLSVLKVILFSKFSTRLPEKQGDTISILGTGPSLKVSLEKYADYFKRTTLFCVNHFASSQIYEELKPQYYLMLDPAFSDFDESRHAQPLISSTLQSLEKKTSWKMFLFVPVSAKNSFSIKALADRNSNIKICYFNNTLVTGFRSVSWFFYRKNLGMARCTNVLCGCLFLSLNMGYKKIYLFGADHSWHEEWKVLDDNTLLGKTPHFDDKDDTEKKEKLYDSIEKKEPLKIHSIFWWGYKAFYDYIVMNEYAIKLKADICNASEKSYIDAFRREKPAG